MPHVRSNVTSDFHRQNSVFEGGEKESGGSAVVGLSRKAVETDTTENIADGETNVRKSNVRMLTLENQQIDELYEMYPRKKARATAERAILKALKKTPFETIKAGLERQISEWKDNDVEAQYIPYPATWFNARSWEDSPDPPGLKPGSEQDPMSPNWKSYKGFKEYDEILAREREQGQANGTG